MLRVLGILVWRLVVIAAWVVVLGGLGLLVVEESGVLKEVVRAGLAWRLGPLGEGLSLERVSLRWFEPGLVLEDVRLRAPEELGGGGEELLRLRSVRFALHPDWERDQPLRELHVEGGRIRISDTLLDGLNHLAASLRSEDDVGAPGSGLAPPPLLVRDFEVELELPDASVLELGRVDLRALPEDDGGYRLTGRLLPTLSGAIPVPVEVHVDGRQWQSGLELSATAIDVPFETESFRSPAYLGASPVEAFSGKLTLTATARVEFGLEQVARGQLRARLDDARLLPRPGDPWIEDLDLDLEARFHPRAQDALWDRNAWTVSSHLHASWEETPVELWAQFGSRVPAGATARVWGRAERLPLRESTLEALGALEPSREMWEALAPSGRADTSLALVLRPKPGEDDPLALDSDLCFQLRNTGESAVTFYGFHNLQGERAGVPVPCSDLRGRAIFTLDRSRERPFRLALVDLSAEHGSGPVTGWGVLEAPPPGGAPEESEFDFVFDVPEIAIDERLRDALSKSPLTREIWPAYDPSGGTLESHWRFHQGPSTLGVTAAGTVKVRDTSLRWVDLPISLSGAQGEIELLWSRQPSQLADHPGEVYRTMGVTYSFRNDVADARRTGTVARVQGFARESKLPPVITLDEVPEEWVHGIEIEVDELRLRGQDWDVLTAEFPDLGEQADDLAAKGSVRLRFLGSQRRPFEPYVSDAEALPNVVEVTPVFFPRRTRDLEGRILVRTTSRGDDVEEEVEVRVCLAGSWPGGSELAARGFIPVAGLADVRLYGAGIDAENNAVRGALVRVLADEELGMGTEVDISESRLRGRIDLEVRSEYLAETDDPTDNTYVVFLRENTLEHEDVRLDALRGVLEQRNEVMRSPLVLAELAGHPVELRDVIVFGLDALDRVPDADPVLIRSGLLNDPAALAIQAAVHTRDLPLDVEHLSSILDNETLELLSGSVTWQGKLDVLGATLLLTGPMEPEKEGVLAMRGAMRPHDLTMTFGMPIEISTAEIELREFVMEEGVRAWGEIRGLAASIADRELSDASMILGLVDRRITIDNLAGSFEGGQLRSLGAQGTGSRKALGVDVSEPYRFDVAIRMDEVHVDRLLRGVFPSSIADEGLLSADIQLSGTPGEILGLTGRGQLRLDEGRLWSIPAARELFSQLGFPNTAVFDRLRTRFELRDGVIDTHWLEVKSRLLNLVGHGTLDFDGRVAYDLEVRYGLLDALGILNRVLYFLNNSLWRVAVRGDITRPRISIRNSLIEVFRKFDENPPRGLPVPDFAPLAPRF